MMFCPQGLLIKRKIPTSKSKITANVIPKALKNIRTNFLMGFGFFCFG